MTGKERREQLGLLAALLTGDWDRADASRGRIRKLSITDTGTGMSSDVAARAFEPFFTTKEVGKGTGLGLATVYGIVQQNNGLVWVYSEPNRGTTFKIYLPSAEEKLGGRTESMIEAPVRRREGTTIVLVEDDEIMLSLTRQLLLENGYTVLPAKDGNAALEIVRSHPEPIHLLLTDVVMPIMNGIELAQRVEAASPSTKVLLMSGYVTAAVKGSGRPLLSKPFRTNDLLAAIRQLLDSRSAFRRPAPPSAPRPGFGPV